MRASRTALRAIYVRVMDVSSKHLQKSRRLALFLPLAKLDSTDLPAHRLRKVFDELDLARILVRSGDFLHVVLELFCQLARSAVSGPQLDECFDDASTHRIRARDDGRLEHSGMREKGALHLERSDTIAG